LTLPDERWNDFEMKRWHQFFVKHTMTLLMTSLPRFPYGRRTQVLLPSKQGVVSCGNKTGNGAIGYISIETINSMYFRIITGVRNSHR
jgi:hypothetical protein